MFKIPKIHFRVWQKELEPWKLSHWIQNPSKPPESKFFNAKNAAYRNYNFHKCRRNGQTGWCRINFCTSDLIRCFANFQKCENWKSKICKNRCDTTLFDHFFCIYENHNYGMLLFLEQKTLILGVLRDSESSETIFRALSLFVTRENDFLQF